MPPLTQGTAEQINQPGFVSAYQIDSATGLPVGGIPKSPITDSGNVENKVTDFNTELSKLLNDPTNALGQNTLSAYTGVPGLQELEAMRQGVSGALSPDELAQIEQAGITAGQQFDPLISKAQEEKRQGLPRAVVAAGERGGFMNTQFAGRAALQSTEGGDFIGAGGVLENIKSSYDLNISTLQTQKQEAIQKARSSMENFIRTGRRQDFQDAQENFRLAQDFQQKQSAQNNEKLKALLSVRQIDTERRKEENEFLKSQGLARDPVTGKIFERLDRSYASGIIGEYQYYREQAESIGEQPMTFNQFRIADANMRKSSGGDGTSNDIDPANLIAYAQQYAATGNIPTGIPKGSFGLISAAARTLPKPDGTLIDMNTGIKSSAVSSGLQDGVAALYDVTKKANDLQSIYEFMQQSSASERIRLRTQYNDLKNEIVDLLARARSGAALTADEERRYSSLLPGTTIFNIQPRQRLQDFRDNIESSLKNKLSLNGLRIVGYGDDAANFDE